MFINFEGIDGSGKTTLSNRLAQRLVKLGYRVAHAREGGELQAPLARRVRDLTRDSQLLEMCPQAEFFLNLAREAQQLEEIIKPALRRGEICISDRFVHSQVALTAAGRGLPASALEPCAALASQNIWPELVILVDVDPDLARLRKRLGKLSSGKTSLTDSRKGLAGAGLNVRIRQRFLEMAAQDPAHWVVVDNSARPLADVEEGIVECVLSRLEKRAPRRASALALEQPTEVRLDTLEQHFQCALDNLELREPALAAYLLAGIGGLKAHKRRISFLETHPGIIAKGLAGLHDEDSLKLREILKTLAPAEVASSLGTDASPEAMALRQELYGKAPGAVLTGLVGNDSPQAWALREAGLGAGLLQEVLLGLAFVDSPRAWELRANGLRDGLYAATARSVRGLTGPHADELRQVILPRDRLAVVKSLTGLDSDFARTLRMELFPKAMKPVLRSLTGVDAPYADALREEGAPLTKEALDSIDGMDTPAAWSLRERFAAQWPTTVISSLKGLGHTERGLALIEAILSASPGRLAVLRNAYAVTCTPPFRTQATADGTGSVPLHPIQLEG